MTMSPPLYEAFLAQEAPVHSVAASGLAALAPSGVSVATIATAAAEAASPATTIRARFMAIPFRVGFMISEGS
ncbi:hypothetical protein Kisp02_03360 [Kineosporia sp. NBRC 101731]|nr:hypothetical protein Kisp02_03360 [Kineosporia sp. NBRC 101731]